MITSKIQVFCKFVPNKSFGQLLELSPINFLFSSTFNSMFSFIEVRFTDHNSELLEIEERMKLTLVIK